MATLGRHYFTRSHIMICVLKRHDMWYTCSQLCTITAQSPILAYEAVRSWYPEVPIFDQVCQNTLLKMINSSRCLHIFWELISVHTGTELNISLASFQISSRNIQHIAISAPCCSTVNLGDICKYASSTILHLQQRTRVLLRQTAVNSVGKVKNRQHK